MTHSHILLLRAWLSVRVAELRHDADRGEGIVTTITMIVGFVLIALAVLAVLKVTVMNGANGVKTQ